MNEHAKTDSVFVIQLNRLADAMRMPLDQRSASLIVTKAIREIAKGVRLAQVTSEGLREFEL